MMSGLSIGILINGLLGDLLPGKLFPMYADLDTPAPLMVYKRTGVEELPPEDKDAGRTDAVEVSLFCVADTYEEAVRLAEQARERLSLENVSTHGFDVIGSRLVDAADEEDNGTHIQGLKFEIIIKHR